FPAPAPLKSETIANPTTNEPPTIRFIVPPFANRRRPRASGALDVESLRAAGREFGRPSVLGGHLQPERHENGAGHGVERAPNPRAAKEVAGLRDDDRVAGQPCEGHCREGEAEPEQRGERGAELRQQAREEDRHLRVAEVADDALPPRLSRSEPS